MYDDVRAAMRSFRTARGSTLAALVVLMLGIGATTAIFSVVDAVVLRGLPFDEHDRLVAVGQRTANPPAAADPNRDPQTLMNVAPQNYVDWRERQQVFEAIAAIGSGWLTLRGEGAEPESLVPQRVTAGFFDVLRVRPAVGTAFTAGHETAGRDRVAVISDGLWRRRFGGDPAIIGRTIPLEMLEGGRAAADGGYVVLGVMPPGFTYPVGASRATDVWIPFVVPERDRVRDPSRMSTYLQVIARLKPGVSIQQAQAQMDQLAAALEQAHPVWNRDSRIGVRPLLDHMLGARLRSWMLMLLAAVAMVLLIACANVASLLLARAIARERDMAVRSALGASRWRLVRQLIVESVLLAGLGTAGGVVLAWWGVDLLRAAMPDGVPRVTTIAVDRRVLACAAGAALATGLLFGLVPALQCSRPDLTNRLKDGARSGGAAGRQRLRSTLVVAEVALAVVLLVGAALFIGSFRSVMGIDLGFDPQRVLTAQVTPRVESLTKPADRSAVLIEIAGRIGRIPGVQHAAFVSGYLPLSDGLNSTSFPIRGKPGIEVVELSIKRVTPAYHQALRIPLLRGRLFTDADRQGASEVGIINDAAARKYFAGEEPVGQEFNGVTVVGVVGDARQGGPERETMPEMYLPIAQSRVFGGDLVVRTAGDPYDVLSAIKAALYGVLPDVPLRNVTTLEQTLARRLAQHRLSMLLLGLFGMLGLVIATVGIYALMAFVVAQRTREIGVRMALGASRGRVVAMVMRKALALVAAGLIAGSAAAWYASAAARAFLFGLEPTDGRAFAAAAASLLVAAVVAGLIPARRAAGVDPMVALRN